MKRLDLFILARFLPLFAMTFMVCTFIVLLQFLWIHLEDLVGKGLDFTILLELFTYAALSMVPMALPLAVLLASLMVFGNLGEHMELTALRMGGISLFRVMKPLLILMIFVSVGAFFFQNDVLPRTQTKMWTLLKSIKQKSPELEINEGEFNYQLPNINIYIDRKDRETGEMYDVMIYDMRQGFDRARVIMADTAIMKSAADKTSIYLTLIRGELFENMREGSGQNALHGMMYRRELFSRKEISIDFDMNLEMVDEQKIGSLYVGQNVSQLRESIDSINHRIDSIGAKIGSELVDKPLVSFKYASLPDEVKAWNYRPAFSIDPDSARRSMSFGARRRYFESARSALDSKRIEYLSRAIVMADELKILRMHGVELHRKFTLSLACLVFFFIGAPLGAIIRKGGIGIPLVVSVLLFIVYYIIDNTGVKMAKDGSLPVWQGMWLSSFIILPLGVYVTYKAVHDSAVFNAEPYKQLWRIITGKNGRALSVKEVVIEEFVPQRAIMELQRLDEECAEFLRKYPRPCGYLKYWRGGILSADIREFNSNLELTVSYVGNARSRRIIDRLSDLPIIDNFRVLHPARCIWSTLSMWFVPVGLAAWVTSLVWQRRLLREVKKVRKLLPQIIVLIEEKYLQNGKDKA